VEAIAQNIESRADVDPARLPRRRIRKRSQLQIIRVANPLIDTTAMIENRISN
jgi:hypothetical protein